MPSVCPSQQTLLACCTQRFWQPWYQGEAIMQNKEIKTTRVAGRGKHHEKQKRSSQKLKGPKPVKWESPLWWGMVPTGCGGGHWNRAWGLGGVVCGWPKRCEQRHRTQTHGKFAYVSGPLFAIFRPVFLASWHKAQISTASKVPTTLWGQPSFANSWANNRRYSTVG